MDENKNYVPSLEMKCKTQNTNFMKWIFLNSAPEGINFHKQKRHDKGVFTTTFSYKMNKDEKQTWLQKKGVHLDEHNYKLFVEFM
jgi:hypothetical protein